MFPCVASAAGSPSPPGLPTWIPRLDLHDQPDALNSLARLLKVKSEHVGAAVMENRSLRILEEAAAATFSLGTQHAGHWHPWPRRLRRGVSSTLYQCAYRLGLPIS